MSNPTVLPRLRKCEVCGKIVTFYLTETEHWQNVKISQRCPSCKRFKEFR